MVSVSLPTTFSNSNHLNFVRTLIWPCQGSFTLHSSLLRPIDNPLPPPLTPPLPQLTFWRTILVISSPSCASKAVVVGWLFGAGHFNPILTTPPSCPLFLHVILSLYKIAHYKVILAPPPHHIWFCFSFFPFWGFLFQLHGFENRHPNNEHMLKQIVCMCVCIWDSSRSMKEMLWVLWCFVWAYRTPSFTNVFTIPYFCPRTEGCKRKTHGSVH